MKPLQQYIDIREEMELIKEKQQEIILESDHPDQSVGEQMTSEDSKKVWKLEIVWEYLHTKLFLDDKMTKKYLN